MENLVNSARLIAESAHAGHKDRGGVDYFGGHIKSVAELVGSDSHLKAIAYLHDVLEDTNIEAEELKSRLAADGCNKTDIDLVVEAVVALTKVKGESYKDYLAKVSKNPLAVKVKIADITNNMDPSRALPDDPMYEYRISKYQMALKILEE